MEKCKRTCMKIFSDKITNFHADINENEKQFYRMDQLIKIDKIRVNKISNSENDDFKVRLSPSGSGVIIDEGVVIDHNSTFFTFTDSVISLKNPTTFDRNYKEIQAGDRLLIWQTLSREGVEHIVGHVITSSGKQFSFGFGYLGDDTGDSLDIYQRAASYLTNVHKQPGAMYTPDTLFESRILQQVLKPKNNYLRVIASSILTEENIINMYSRFDSVVSVKEDFLKLEIYYMKKLSSPETIVYNLLYYLRFPELQYCTWSTSANPKETNCAGFIEQMFGDIISCPGFVTSVKPNPESCYQHSQIAPCTTSDEDEDHDKEEDATPHAWYLN